MEGLSKIEVPGTRREHGTGATGASEPKPWFGATHPHAPGARMTVVKQTPSNNVLLLKRFLDTLLLHVLVTLAAPVAMLWTIVESGTHLKHQQAPRELTKKVKKIARK